MTTKLEVGKEYDYEEITENAIHGLIIRDSYNNDAYYINGGWYGDGTPDYGGNYSPWTVVSVPQVETPTHEKPAWASDNDTLVMIPVYIRPYFYNSGPGQASQSGPYEVRLHNGTHIINVAATTFATKLGVEYADIYKWDEEKYGDIEKAREIAKAVADYDLACTQV